MLRRRVGFRAPTRMGSRPSARRADRDRAHCVVDKDLFASEFVVRAGREGKNVVEIPLRVQEKRKPSDQSDQAVPNAAQELWSGFTYVIR